MVFWLPFHSCTELCIFLVCRRVGCEGIFPGAIKILAEGGGLRLTGVRMPAQSSLRRSGTPASSAKRLSLSLGSLLGAASHPRACSLPPRSGVQRGGSAQRLLRCRWLEARRDFGMCLLEVLSCLCTPLCVELEYPGE